MVIAPPLNGYPRSMKKDKTITAKQKVFDKELKPSPFSVVAIGASAGGIKALEELFDSLPADTGMAYVVILHLDGDHDSKLVDILADHTKMTIQQAKDNMSLEPNMVVVIPPGYDPALLKNRLQLMKHVAPRGQAQSINYFFRSLAQDRNARAISIILSGSGADGSRYLGEIKASGGIVIAQSPDSAEYDDMPRAAINTGLVDLILKPADMGAHLVDIGSGRLRPGGRNSSDLAPNTDDYLQKIFILLRNQSGHDFSGYKEGVIRRRVERRMLLHQINHISHYVRFLQQNSDEVDTLFQDLLIGVTSFFRDPDAYRCLRDKALTPLLANQPERKPLRIWVVGCSTGEEAYTMAMLAHEQMEKSDWHGKIQIFATDIDTQAVNFARSGVYTPDAVEGIDQERRLRFFSRQKNGYHVRKKLRDLVVFAEQSVIRDPPFSNLHLISCRNLLIYMTQELHHQLFPLFYHALTRNGYLLLGKSENIAALVEYFKPLSRKQQLYQRQGNLVRKATSLIPNRMTVGTMSAGHRKEQRRSSGHPVTNRTLQLLSERTLLAKFSPAAALINLNREVLYYHGPVDEFLQLSPGEARYDIVSLVLPELKHILDKAISTCLTSRKAVCKPGLRYKIKDQTRLLDLCIEPVGERREDQIMIVAFTQVRCPEELFASVQPGISKSDTRGKIIAGLEQELKTARDRIAALVEEAAIADLESRSILEELKSSNQELQAANEELETSREELQSTSEELVTVNQELEQRLAELSELNNDMVNLLAATDIGTIFLDPDLIIQRFTPAIARVINLRPSDEGRPLRDLYIKLDYDTLINDAEKVLTTLDPIAKEIPGTEDNRWYLVHILPYRTTRGEIQGVVISFIDITWRHQAEAEVKRSRSELEQIFNSAADGMQVILMDCSTLRVNDTFVRMIGRTREECRTKKCWELFPGPLCQGDNCSLKRIKNGEELVNEQVTVTKPDGSKVSLALTTRPFIDNNGQIIGIIMCYRDISQLRKKEEQFQSIFNNAADAILWTDTTTMRIIRSNRAAEKLLGWSKNELIGMEYLHIHPPEKRTKYRQFLVDNLQKGQILKGNPQLFTRSGATMPTEVHSSLHEFDGHLVIQSIYRDLSTEKALQKKLSHQQKMASRYLDIATSLIVAIDRDESISLLNRQGYETFGYKKDELIGQNWFETCIPKHERDKMRAVFYDLMNGKIKSGGRFSNPILTADGQEVPMIWFNSLLTDDNGKIIGTLSAGNIFRKIS